MAKAHYGDSWERYPLEAGKVYGVGEHRFACGDALKTNGYFLPLDTPALVYSDPPWRDQDVKAFYTKAGLTGQYTPFGLLIALLLNHCKRARFAAIEMGKANLSYTVQEIERGGGSVLSVFPITYYHKHPHFLIVCSWRPGAVLPQGFDPSGMDDDDTPMYCIERLTKTGQMVFDLCMGQGLTAVSAHKLGRVAYGCELNPRRLAVTVDRLVKLGVSFVKEPLYQVW